MIGQHLVNISVRLHTINSQCNVLTSIPAQTCVCVCVSTCTRLRKRKPKMNLAEYLVTREQKYNSKIWSCSVLEWKNQQISCFFFITREFFLSAFVFLVLAHWKQLILMLCQSSVLLKMWTNFIRFFMFASRFEYAVEQWFHNANDVLFKFK